MKPLKPEIQPHIAPIMHNKIPITIPSHGAFAINCSIEVVPLRAVNVAAVTKRKCGA
jgi:hypothetical protein